jgi:CRP/FNR family cyclic AMP-dependent transcriptional regulator
MAELEQFLAQVPLFQGAPSRALEIAAQALQPRTFAPDTVLFQEGDKGEVLYILKEGIVKLFKIDLEGHEKTLAILKPPEFFGEMALLGEQGRSATALAIRESKIYLLFKDDFQRLIKDYPSISLNVANTLSQRLHGMNDEAQILSYKDAQGRVAYVILRLYWGGLIDFNDQGQALLRLTHQELASLAGTSRETVTRALKALEEEAVIRTRPKEVLIQDPEGLEEILHGIR